MMKTSDNMQGAGGSRTRIPGAGNTRTYHVSHSALVTGSARHRQDASAPSPEQALGGGAL